MTARSVHEAGHALALLKRGIPVRSCSIRRAGSTGGHVIPQIPMRDLSEHDLLFMLAAGAAAERRLTGRAAQFDADDREQMKTLAAVMKRATPESEQTATTLALYDTKGGRATRMESLGDGFGDSGIAGGGNMREPSVELSAAWAAFANRGMSLEGLSEKHLDALGEDPYFRHDVSVFRARQFASSVERENKLRREAAAPAKALPPPQADGFAVSLRFKELLDHADMPLKLGEILSKLAHESPTVAVPMQIAMCLGLMIDAMDDRNRERNERLDALTSRVAELEQRPAGAQYEGTWGAQKCYSRNAMVTHGGSCWVSTKDNNRAATPGVSYDAWRLAVKGTR
jgi:hypothetical protein